MASTETFDPKRYTPFAPGVHTSEVLSTFPAIDTAVDHIKFSQGLESIGKVIDRGALIRTFQAADLGFILHSRHQFHWHTGYVPPQPMAVPHIGAVLAKTLGPRVDTMPPFISIGQNLENGGESAALKSFHTAGFLGSEYGPVLLADPQDAASAVRPPSDLGSARFVSRRKLYEGARQSARLSVRRRLPAAQVCCALSTPRTVLLTSPSAKAFDLSLEARNKFDAYNTSRFGQGCLLARRLVESGARYVEVTSEYIPFRWWDSHQDGHSRAEMMKKIIDGPVAQLVLDLRRARPAQPHLLVVLASEFSRDAVTEGKVGKEVEGSVKHAFSDIP